jgi:hypothetical protein
MKTSSQNNSVISCAVWHALTMPLVVGLLFLMFASNQALACEAMSMSVHLYVAETESAAQGTTQTEVYICDPGTPFWVRVKWTSAGPGDLGRRTGSWKYGNQASHQVREKAIHPRVYASILTTSTGI